jgi:hypothetical protein
MGEAVGLGEGMSRTDWAFLIAIDMLICFLIAREVWRSYRGTD